MIDSLSKHSIKVTVTFVCVWSRFVSVSPDITLGHEITHYLTHLLPHPWVGERGNRPWTLHHRCVNVWMICQLWRWWVVSVATVTQGSLWVTDPHITTRGGSSDDGAAGDDGERCVGVGGFRGGRRSAMCVVVVMTSTNRECSFNTAFSHYLLQSTWVTVSAEVRLS